MHLALRKKFALISALISFTLVLSLLPATESKASTGDIPFIGSTVLSDYDTSSPHYFQLPTKTWCPDSYGTPRWAPWVLQVNETEGTQVWLNPADDPNYRFSQSDVPGMTTVKVSIPVHYPGAVIRAYIYGDGCSGQPDPSTTPPSYSSSPINLTWDRTYSITNAVFTSFSSWNSMAMAFTNDPHAVATAYVIRNYGTPQQQVMSSGYSYPSCDTKPFPTACQTSINRNFYSGTVGDWVDTFGFAIMPDYLKDYNGTQWPPPGALDSQVAKNSDRGGPFDIRTTSQFGPSESTPAQRVPTADPIDNYSGNFYSHHSDVAISGRIGLSTDRAYSSAAGNTLGSMGYGWHFSYDMQVATDPSTGNASVTEGKGNVLPYVYQFSSDSYLAASPVIHADLTKTVQGWDFKRWNELRTYHFSADGKLSSITDNNANVVTVEHDAVTGQVTKVTEGDRWITFNWANNLVQSATDNAGRVVTYSYDGQQNLVSVVDVNGGVTSYAYDSAHRMTSTTDANNGVMTNIYDTQGRVVEQHSPAGQVTKLTYGTLDSDNVQNKETIGDVTRTYSYFKGRIVDYTDSADSSQNFSQSYDKNGNPYYSKMVSDPDGAETYTSFDDRGNVTKAIHPASNAMETMTWNSQSQLLKHTDRLGAVTTNTYDQNGNLTATSQTSANGQQSRSTSYVVASNGDVTQVTNPLGGVSMITSTSDGELASLTDPNGNKTTYAYDSLGRKTSVVSPGGNASGVVDAAKFTQSFTYDAAGNTLSVAGALGTTQYTYDAVGNPLTIVDPRGHSSSTVFDADGHATKVTHADGSTDTFTYDPYTGERASWTDAQGRTTTYLHRGLDTTVTSPDGTVSKTTRAYSDSGGGYSSVSLTDPFNNNALITERKFNGKTAVVTNNAGSTQASTTYTSDTGLKTSEQTANGTTSFAYDGFGSMTSSTSTAAGRNIAYQYDAAGNITKITYPDGTSVTRTLDQGGRVTSLTDWSGIIYSLSYTSDGKLGSVTASNGLSYQQGYDGTLPTDKTWKDGAGAVLAAFGSAYDSTGQLSGTTNAVNGGTESNPVEWNANNQVAKTGTSPVTWVGNRVTSTDRLSALNYSSNTGRLTDTTDLNGASTTFSFDATGRRTSSTSNGVATNYSWNVLGQLTNAGTDTYTYDNSGLRTTVNGAQQSYGQDMKLLSDGTNKFLWGTDGALLAQAPLGATTGSTPLQAVTNGMGSVYEIVQSQPVAGTPGANHLVAVSQYIYSLFGERTLVAGTDVTSMGYVSEQRDSTTGFIYLRARYYDPKTAQFISSDPLIAKTLDEYGYAGGNPLQLIDPLGLDWLGDSLKFIYDNSDSLSLIATGLALACTATGVGAPVATVFLATAYALNVVATVKAANDGDALGVGLGIAGMAAPGVTKVGKIIGKVGLSKTAQAVDSGAISSRKEFKSAIGWYDSTQRLTEGFDLYSNVGSAMYTGRQTLEKINALGKCG